MQMMAESSSHDPRYPRIQSLCQENGSPKHVRPGGVDVQAAKRLLAAGADPDAANSRAETPLQWAAWSGSRDMVELLLEHGAQLHHRDNSPLGGWTSLLCAALQVCCALTPCDTDQLTGISLLSCTLRAHTQAMI